MAGPGPTSGALQGFYLKLESITDSLIASTTYGDFVGAGKIVDPTDATTFEANVVAVIGDTSVGGSAKTVDISEWRKGNSQYVVGQNMDSVEFEVIRNRKDTTSRALEAAGTSVACWFAIFSQDVPGHGGAAADASVHVGYGTISVKADYKDESPSTLMVTISPRAWKDPIDA